MCTVVCCSFPTYCTVQCCITYYWMSPYDCITAGFVDIWILHSVRDSVLCSVDEKKWSDTVLAVACLVYSTPTSSMLLGCRDVVSRVRAHVDVDSMRGRKCGNRHTNKKDTKTSTCILPFSSTLH